VLTSLVHTKKHPKPVPFHVYPLEQFCTCPVTASDHAHDLVIFYMKQTEITTEPFSIPHQKSKQTRSVRRMIK